jgi:glycosyltransferase involved in cell wall biosynthesis
LPPGRPWVLLVAGRDHDPGAPYERQCRERADQPDLAGRVRFVGYLEDPAPFYRAVDVAVVPSLEEPMGRIPLEAAAYARPSVAFATGGLPDVVRDNQTGWLVPTGDWAALAAVLDRLRDDPRPDVGEAARAWVEEAANPACYTARLVALYRRLLGRVTAPAAPVAG